MTNTVVTIDANIPSERRFVIYRNERPGGQAMKVYYSVLGGRKASTTDATTWGTLTEAQQSVASGMADGIGVVEGEGATAHFVFFANEQELQNRLKNTQEKSSMNSTPTASATATTTATPAQHKTVPPPVTTKPISSKPVATTPAAAAAKSSANPGETTTKTTSCSKKTLKIADIIMEPAMSCRAERSEEVIAEYAEAVQRGDVFPLPVVFLDSAGRTHLADGASRILAARKNGKETIESEIRDGNRGDAIRYALKANATHGLRRTNADKHACVIFALGEFPTLSSRQIADLCKVSDKTVGAARGNCGNSAVHQRLVGADGKTRPASRARAAVKVTTPAEAAPVTITAAAATASSTAPMTPPPPATSPWRVAVYRRAGDQGTEIVISVIAGSSTETSALADLLAAGALTEVTVPGLEAALGPILSKLDALPAAAAAKRPANTTKPAPACGLLELY